MRADAVKKLAVRYTSPELGSLEVPRQGAKPGFKFAHRNCKVALRKHEERSQSYIAIDPVIGGVEPVRGNTAKRPTLILRDAQHQDRFVAGGC